MSITRAVYKRRTNYGEKGSPNPNREPSKGRTKREKIRVGDMKPPISRELKASLNDAPPVPAKPSSVSDASRNWVSAVGLGVLSFNSVVAVYHSRHDRRSVAFVVASFLDLLLLFYFLSMFENLPRGSPKRLHVKAVVWALSTVLTLMFSQRVAALMPLPVAIVVWAMAASTIFAGFCMFFVCRDEVAADDEKPAKVVEGP